MHVSVKSPLKELSEVASSLVVNMVGVEIGTTPCLEYPDFERIVEVNPVSSLLPTSKDMGSVLETKITLHLATIQFFFYQNPFVDVFPAC